MRRAALAFLLVFAGTTVLAEDFWAWVQIDTSNADVVEGRPAQLRLALPCLNCTSPVTPIDLPLNPTDIVTWSFGDGSHDVTVTGSASVMHTFPRGWFAVTAQASGHTIHGRIFSAPVFV